MQQSVNNGTRSNLNIADHTQRKFATAVITSTFGDFTKNKACTRFHLGSNTAASPQDKATMTSMKIADLTGHLSAFSNTSVQVICDTASPPPPLVIRTVSRLWSKLPKLIARQIGLAAFAPHPTA